MRGGPFLISARRIAFTVQIFADFSGYTDMARGTARMLGFELVENFKSPFLATSTPDFWQRWHISLSQWIRDYIMVPLLGTGRVTNLRYIAAALVTFTLIGFWHGASWNFILFGLFHGMGFAGLVEDLDTLLVTVEEDTGSFEVETRFFEWRDEDWQLDWHILVRGEWQRGPNGWFLHRTSHDDIKGTYSSL